MDALKRDGRRRSTENVDEKGYREGGEERVDEGMNSRLEEKIREGKKEMQGVGERERERV